jgi:hypothetical protein
MPVPLKLRRSVYSVATLIVATWLGFAYFEFEKTLPRLVYLTGWLLLALCLALTAYNLRKKLPFLPLFSSRLWLQFHTYAGLLTGIVFIFHLRFVVPSGPFNLLLAGLFLAVTFSGIGGWWLSRVVPRRLTTAGGEVPYERIPLVRRDLRRRADETALAAIPEAKDTTLADFYLRALAPAFAVGPRFLPQLLGSRRALNDRLAALEEAGRFLGPTEKARAEILAGLVRARHALDFQHANQLLLRAWLFVHVPLTYGLLLFTLVHVMLVHAFSGGAR